MRHYIEMVEEDWHEKATFDCTQIECLVFDFIDVWWLCEVQMVSVQRYHSCDILAYKDEQVCRLSDDSLPDC